MKIRKQKVWDEWQLKKQIAIFESMGYEVEKEDGDFIYFKKKR